MRTRFTTRRWRAKKARVTKWRAKATRRACAERARATAHRVVGLFEEREESGIFVVFEDFPEVGGIHRDVCQELPVVGTATLIDVAEEEVKHLPHRARGCSVWGGRAREG